MIDDEVHSVPPQAGGVTPKPPPQSVEYGSYKLTSDLAASLVTLIVGLSWPVTAFLIFGLLAQHGSGLLKSLNEFMRDKQSLELAMGPKEGLSIKIVQEVQKGLSQQIAAGQSGSVSADQKNNIQQAALSAAAQLAPQANRLKNPAKVLWVDDHPENNIGLQYAFQTLGIVVICIDSDSRIEEAFTTAGGFDVMITDVHRDAVGKRPEEPEAGLKTVQIARSQHPGVPVIIYSGSYAEAHKKDPVVAPVVVTTNDPQQVFNIVTDIAAKKNRN